MFRRPLARARPTMPPVPTDMRRRATLAENLALMRQLPRDAQDEFIDQVQQLSKDFRGFGYTAPATQHRQDRHLRLYYEYLAFKEQREVGEMDEAELDRLGFLDDDFEKIFENFREFLIVYYLQATPRSRLTGDRISYSQLCSVRESLQFWTRYKRMFKRLDPIPLCQLFRVMTEVMRAVVVRFPDLAAQESRATKTYLGLAELRELFDYEMMHNHSIELSEQHQACWAFTRVIACGPSSIGSSGKTARDPPLIWRDFQFEVVGSEAGKFKLTVTFPNIDIKAPDVSDKQRFLSTLKNRAVVIKLEPPNVDNLIFSPAHRLLVMALRRGILEDISNLNELWAWDKQFIRIKPEHLDDVVFCRGNAKGGGIDTSGPLTVGAMSAYLKSRCYKLGYTDHMISMHSIRQRAATDLMTRMWPAAPEADLEETADTDTVFVFFEQDHSTREDGAAPNEDTVSFVLHCYAFMDTLLNNPVNEDSTFAERELTCFYCEEDETVPDEYRVRVWDSEAKLRSHMNSDYHSPMAKFKRAAESHAAGHPVVQYYSRSSIQAYAL